MRVLADSHAIVWYLNGSAALSDLAASTLVQAEATDGVVVSVATLVDLWYVTETTKKVAHAELALLRGMLASSPGLVLQSIDLDVVDATTSIPRKLLGDPWDRFIVATAKVLAVPLITRDSTIRDSGLVQTIW